MIEERASRKGTPARNTSRSDVGEAGIRKGTEEGCRPGNRLTGSKLYRSLITVLPFYRLTVLPFYRLAVLPACRSGRFTVPTSPRPSHFTPAPDPGALQLALAPSQPP